jgi:hypothetical protein
MFIFLLYISHLSWNTNQPQPKKDHNMSKSIKKATKNCAGSEWKHRKYIANVVQKTNLAAHFYILIMRTLSSIA